jgi:ankyrin repeat protein
LLELVVQSDNVKARPEMLRTLLAISAINSDKTGKQRALGKAAENGLVDLAKMLIAAGADPSARFDAAYGNKDETYLSLSAMSGIWAMIDDALSRPHDIHAVDSEGRTALVAAAWSTAPREDIFPIIDRLLDAGADRSEIDRVLHDIDFSNWIPGLKLRRQPKSQQNGGQYQSLSWVQMN